MPWAALRPKAALSISMTSSSGMETGLTTRMNRAGRCAAIVTAGVSRLRPVSMAALTTALGMIPLIFDAFFVAMAVTIIFGLMIATVLTMIVVPVFYSIFFRVAYESA